MQQTIIIITKKNKLQLLKPQMLITKSFSFIKMYKKRYSFFFPAIVAIADFFVACQRKLYKNISLFLKRKQILIFKKKRKN